MVAGALVVAHHAGLVDPGRGWRTVRRAQFPAAAPVHVVPVGRRGWEHVVVSCKREKLKCIKKSYY